MPMYANDSVTIGNYDVTELVYENFDSYLQEEDNMQHPDYAMQMLTSESKFSSFIGKLTEGMSPQQVSSVTAVCNRQREYLLEESRTQFGSTPEVVGYAVN